MPRNAGRIGKVRMKATGFEFRVIEGPTDPESDYGARMIDNARQIASWPEMTGYVVMGLYRDGTSSVGIRWSDECVVPRALAPAWIAEILRRDLITAAEAEGVFHENFKWVD